MTTLFIDAPTELHQAWAERFNAGDVDGMLALAEPGSTFAPAPGAVVTDGDYRAALSGFVALGLPIELTLKRAVQSDDVALLVYDWTIDGTAADGNDVHLAGTTADVARRGPHGWRFVIDNPFGTA
jgi:ketosteroid isomerase-like protein